jgi:hypothetical protein
MSQFAAREAGAAHSGPEMQTVSCPPKLRCTQLPESPLLVRVRDADDASTRPLSEWPTIRSERRLADESAFISTCPTGLGELTANAVDCRGNEPPDSTNRQHTVNAPEC